jgi:hypothetical protein
VIGRVADRVLGGPPVEGAGEMFLDQRVAEPVLAQRADQQITLGTEAQDGHQSPRQPAAQRQRDPHDQVVDGPDQGRRRGHHDRYEPEGGQRQNRDRPQSGPSVENAFVRNQDYRQPRCCGQHRDPLGHGVLQDAPAGHRLGEGVRSVSGAGVLLRPGRGRRDEQDDRGGEDQRGQERHQQDRVDLYVEHGQGGQQEARRQQAREDDARYAPPRRRRRGEGLPPLCRQQGGQQQEPVHGPGQRARQLGQRP